MLSTFVGLLFALAAQQSRPVEEDVVRVPLRDGKVSVRALAQALATAAGLEGRALDVGDREVSLDGIPAALALAALSPLTYGAFEVRREEGALAITIDRALARDLRHDAKRALGFLLEKISGESLAAAAPVLDLPSPASPFEPVVLLVHGLGGGGETWSALRRALATQAPELAVGEFRYASREAIDDSGAALAAALAEYRRANPQRPVYVVAHSLGGLVARWAVETPSLDPGNVRLLVLLGAPHGGSRLARTHLAFDLLELATASAQPRDFPEVMRRVLGNADADLKPGSTVLESLALKERNPRVAYRSVIGTRAPLSASDAAQLRTLAARGVGELPASDLYGDALRETIADLDELEDGKGDGVVSLRRAALPGVDAVQLPLDHLELTRAPSVHARIVSWLKARRRFDREV